MMKKIIASLLVLIMLCSCFVSCDKDGEGGKQVLSFSMAQSVEEMKKLDGKEVTIIGYMSTLSPVSGAFMYLMNMPYQSCPFCLPNTNQLSNTIAVYAKDKDGFEFTDRAIQVTGRLEFGNYTDEFEYEYSYRIVDATYSILDTSNMSDELKRWQQLASTDVVSEIYTMLDYVNFLCYWSTQYTMQYEYGKDYVYPTYAIMLIEEDGASYNYGFKEGYFEDIIAKIKSVDPTAFEDLVKIVEDAKFLSEFAYRELKDGNYVQISEYSDLFGDGRQQYKLTKATEIEENAQNIYIAFSNWISSWEI